MVPGATTGQLGLAPDNQFQQIRGTAGYDFSPTIRVTGEVAWGRMTQNDGFLAPTENTILAPTVPPLPANSLDGKIDTFTANVKMTANPMQGLRLTASYDRDSRDNKTPVRSYPIVTTDMIVGATPRSNTPFSFTLDRVKLIGDYSGGLPAQHADHRRRRVRHARAQLPGSRDDPRVHALGQGRGATDREAVDLAEVRVFVARQLRSMERRSGSATRKTRCCASSTWRTASATWSRGGSTT